MADLCEPTTETEAFLKDSAKHEKNRGDKMNFYARFFASSVKDLKDAKFYRALIGEMLGVMFLVFVGCNSPYGAPELDLTRVSLSFGLSVATLVWFLADVSGGHINPAVSAGMLCARKISLMRFLLYVFFQCTGAVMGAAIMQSLTCNWQTTYADTALQAANATCGLGVTNLGPGVTPGQGCVIELLVTFVLVTTVFATCDCSRSDLNGSGPLAIGLSVTMCHLGFIRMTGSSMNTARTFGPAAILGEWDNQWVYWVGPISGGILAGLVYEFFFAGNASVSKLYSWLVEENYEKDDDSCFDVTSSLEMKGSSQGSV
ncbi:aquaporin-5-like isoform X1 [Watersipora subatra]|uniref:aquaporin-5-like isoform X1 n=2 Tax=Watersipora subatra TaxID=2589382 RepID=UPI00355C1F47